MDEFEEHEDKQGEPSSVAVPSGGVLTAGNLEWDLNLNDLLMPVFVDEIPSEGAAYS